MPCWLQVSRSAAVTCSRTVPDTWATTLSTSSRMLPASTFTDTLGDTVIPAPRLSRLWGWKDPGPSSGSKYPDPVCGRFPSPKIWDINGPRSGIPPIPALTPLGLSLPIDPICRSRNEAGSSPVRSRSADTGSSTL
ncbi:hypothetical protein LCGC14_2441140 [marine sediment metagenome]|uniref:Uncharacterized protein n=1 Tax=marine sediment metagenome TaxID=412755 RepID=A0A0F9BIW5_9ZZZZ